MRSMHQRHRRLVASAKRYDDSPEGPCKAVLTRVGIQKVTANLKEQLVSVEGNAAPSAIVEAIQSTGRDAILRGSGKSNSTLAELLKQLCEVQIDSSWLHGRRMVLIADLQALLYAY